MAKAGHLPPRSLTFESVNVRPPNWQPMKTAGKYSSRNRGRVVDEFRLNTKIRLIIICLGLRHQQPTARGARQQKQEAPDSNRWMARKRYEWKPRRPKNSHAKSVQLPTLQLILRQKIDFFLNWAIKTGNERLQQYLHQFHLENVEM